MEEVLRPDMMIQEDIEMRNITSLSVQQVNSVNGMNEKAVVARHCETKIQLGKISNVYNEHEFCNRLISAINIVTAYHDYIDQQKDKHKACSVITNERHLKVTPEELARKWSIGIQTAKDTLMVTTQKGIRTAIHPMT
jgi:hypothetical protein